MQIELCRDDTKQAQMLKLLKFGTVMVFVDSRLMDVVVPSYLKGDYQLRLNFDYTYEIEDFRILPDRLEASLSFNHKNFFCKLPFHAVYLMLCHRVRHGVLFSESIPDEMVGFFVKAAKISHLNSSRALKDTLGPSFELKDNSPETRRGHLRLVKFQ